MNVQQEGITVHSNVLTPLDLTPVPATLDIGWPVIDDRAMVSEK